MRLLKYAIKNILRNKFLSFSSVLVLTLLMLFINILFTLHQVSQTLAGEISSKLDIVLYVNESYDNTSIEVLDLMRDIWNVSGTIVVDYKTSENNLNALRVSDPDLAKIAERTNPLPDTISISDIALNEYPRVNSLVESKIFLLEKNDLDEEHFSNYTTQYKKITQIVSVLNNLDLGLYVIIIIFFVSISVIIYSVIGNFIYYYRNEIYITQLVGGAKQFIYGPFVIQGKIYSIVAFILSFVCFSFLLKNFSLLFDQALNLYIHPFVLLWELIIFMLIGWMSGYFSSKKYIK